MPPPTWMSNSGSIIKNMQPRSMPLSARCTDSKCAAAAGSGAAVFGMHVRPPTPLSGPRMRESNASKSTTAPSVRSRHIPLPQGASAAVCSQLPHAVGLKAEHRHNTYFCFVRFPHTDCPLVLGLVSCPFAACHASDLCSRLDSSEGADRVGSLH